MSSFRSSVGPRLILSAAALAAVLAVHNSGDAGPEYEPCDWDGIPDELDNCMCVPNPTQGDSDLDGYGNACDGDFNNSGLVAGDDFLTFQTHFNTSAPSYNEQVDMNCNGLIAGDDFLSFQMSFNLPTGPSGLACAGTIPCPATAHRCP